MSLVIKGLVKHFGGVHAVRGVSFSVQGGECVALIGPNGAGKSTCFACVAGQHSLTEGEVWWDGGRIDQLAPAHRLQKGVARTFQVAQTFESLSVIQNIQLLLHFPLGVRFLNTLDAADRQAAMAVLARVGLEQSADVLAHNLPYGHKKRLELAMALAGLPQEGPALMLLDEPAAGLAASERKALMQLIKSLQGAESDQDRLTVLYTEHNMDAVFGVADRVIVLIDGEITAQGSPQEIADNPVVQKRYLGTAWAQDVSVWTARA